MAKKSKKSLVSRASKKMMDANNMGGKFARKIARNAVKQAMKGRR